MTPRFEAFVRASVGDAKTCPHGHPIRVGERVAGVPLADCEPGAKVTILRFENEAEDLLHYLKDVGLEPGREGEITLNDGEHVDVAFGDGTSTVTVSVAIAEPATSASVVAISATHAVLSTTRSRPAMARLTMKGRLTAAASAR